MIPKPKTSEESQRFNDRKKWKKGYDTEPRKMQVAAMKFLKKPGIPLGAQLIPMKQLLTKKIENVKKQKVMRLYR